MRYRHDGTFAGLLTVFARIFTWGEIPSEIVVEKDPADLFGEWTDVLTDTAQARRMLRTIENRLSTGAARTILYAHASEEPTAAMAIYRYLVLGRSVGKSLERYLGREEVREVHRLARRVQRESHRFRGLVRFRELEDGLLYAPIEPTCNILPFLGAHFSARQKGPWIIHDCRRHLGLLGEGRKWEISAIEREGSGPLPISVREKEYQNLWRAFFEHISIPERHSSRRQRQFMPVKYWKHLVEMDPEMSEGVKMR